MSLDCVSVSGREHQPSEQSTRDIDESIEGMVVGTDTVDDMLLLLLVVFTESTDIYVKGDRQDP